jgi:membrane protein DedA with SNARE-associated domain
VILGNVGLPIPEETILALGGFLAQRGELHLPTVIAVGMLAAIVGDNIGYWLGRRYGRKALERYGRHIWISADRLERVSGFIARYGG